MTVLLIIAFITIFCFYSFYWKRKNLPDGPIPLPFIGSFHTIVMNSPGYDAFLNWKKQFGPIFTFWQGSEPVVVFCDYESINEAFVKQADKFSNREMYKDFLADLRNGFSGILYEEKVINETVRLIESIKKDSESGVVDIRKHVDMCIGSVINGLLFGYSFEGDKIEEFEYVKELLDKQSKLIFSPLSMIIMPYYKYVKNLPFFKSHVTEIMSTQNVINNFFKKQIKEHLAVHDPDSFQEPLDFVGAFLKEMSKEERENIVNRDFTDIELLSTISDLWAAGLETTINSSLFGILYLIHNPQVQEKLQAELDQVVGSSRIITTSDKNQLIYVQAVVNEIQRTSNLVPMNFTRLCNEDTVVMGHQITKGTQVLPQISCLLYDENVFPNAREFIPERWIDENNQIRKLNEFMPFSVGPRKCIGESLAKMELFIVFANLLNNFTIISSDPNKLPNLKQNMAISVTPDHFTIKIVNRY
uniref:Cytochrome P450 n=1 Tax=Rhabditophanes sp. KR3021 TaxID=114890 RepID=A0AC35UFP6_9BILA